MNRISFSLLLSSLLLSCACSRRNDNANTTATTYVTPSPPQILTVVPRPQKIIAMMKERGEQDEAKPVLSILSPSMNSVINGSTVTVTLALLGDLKGYKPFKDPQTGMGNHIHVILDNEPYEAYFDLGRPFEFHDVKPGRHTLRVFASRPWHESYKNEGAFQMVSFIVGAGDSSKKTSEAVDPTKPLLTYSRPKGEYKGEDADPIMIDFWLSNAKLKDDGGDYRIRYFIDNDDARFIEKWQPVWLQGWTSGKHTVRLELLGKDQYPVKNGSYNITTREISAIK
jgi:hypothetical protein